MFAPFAGGKLAGLGVLLVGWGPAALLAWFVVHRSGQRDKLHQAMLAAAGVAPGAGFDHAEDGTGIALNTATRTVSLLADGTHQSYGYDQIRNWAIQEERAGTVVPAFGVANGIMAAGASARMAREAKANTGLFLTMKDLERPAWRVAMKDQKTRARWMELLRQEVNERGAA
jgi:aldehyde:ferredoxin oxidoreductase